MPLSATAQELPGQLHCARCSQRDKQVQHISGNCQRPAAASESISHVAGLVLIARACTMAAA